MKLTAALCFCMGSLAGAALAYDAVFSDALDQPERVFTGSGWELAPPGYAADGVDAASPVRNPGGEWPPAIFATALPVPAGVRFKARVPQPDGSASPPMVLTVDAPGGITRTVSPSNDAAGHYRFVSLSGGDAIWTALVPYWFDPAYRAVVDELEIFAPVLSASVGVALDQPGMTYLSAAAVPWTLIHTDAHDGVDALTAGALAQGESTDFQVTAPAGMNAVSFWARRDGHAASTLSLIFSGNEIAPAWTATGPGGWEQVSLMLPVAGTTVRWSYRCGGAEGTNAVRIDELQFAALPLVQEAIDLAEPPFAVTAGAQPFTRITSDSADGLDAAESTAGAGDSVMAATVTGPAVLTWDSRVTGTGAALQVVVDQNAPWVCRDTAEWAHHAVFIPAGSHEVRFMASGSNGTARVDQVKVTAWNASLPETPGLTFSQSGIGGWERVPGVPGRTAAEPGFITGDRTGIPNTPDTLSPVLVATATGPGWLSYRSSVGTAASHASTLETPIPGQNHSSGVRAVSMGFPGGGPHPLTWTLRGVASGVAQQQASLSDLKWTVGAHPLGHVGPWVISDDAIWKHTGDASIAWGHSSGSRAASISTTVTGPGTLNFQWDCRTGYYLFGLSGELQVTVSGGGTLALPMATQMAPPGLSAASIPIPDGVRTVTWTLNTSLSQPVWDYPPLVTGSLRNIRLSNQLTDVAEALDTTLPVSEVSGAWVLESGAGWRGGDVLGLNLGSGGFTLQVAGPKVLAFRVTVHGPYNPQESGPYFRVTGPDVNQSFIPALIGSNVYQETHGVVIPPGTHAVSWSAMAAPPPVSGYPPVTWKMDALDDFVPADYAAALNGPYNWQVSAGSGYAPVPQSEQTHDGSRAVEFNFWRAHGNQPDLNSLTTAVAGPGLITWWQKGRLSLKVDGVETSNDDFAQWSRRVVVLPPGAHTLTWSSAMQNSVWRDVAWLDEVQPGNSFENWLAGYYTPAQMNNPDDFSVSADTDHDGRPALMEYALQTSPVIGSPDRAPVLTRDAADAGLQHFTWRQSNAATGITFAAETSVNLTTWTPLTAAQAGTDGSDTLMRASFRTDGVENHGFVRLRVALF
jgi:hypothetical protein